MKTSLVPTSVFVTAMMILVACAGDPPPQEIVRPVRYQPVYATGGAHERWFSGAARADVESRLSFRVAGTVRAINVKVGDQIRKGSVIAELDPTDYQLQVQDAEASLLQAQSQARNASASYTRVQSLYVNQNASRSDLDAALATKESGGVITSSSGPMPKARKAKLKASVPELTAKAKLAPHNSANFCSNTSTSFPKMNRPWSITSPIAANSSAFNGAC